jgi:hypothetical protein
MRSLEVHSQGAIVVLFRVGCSTEEFATSFSSLRFLVLELAQPLHLVELHPGVLPPPAGLEELAPNISLPAP